MALAERDLTLYLADSLSKVDEIKMGMEENLDDEVWELVKSLL